MYYSTTPIPNYDSLNSHVGLYIILVISAIILLLTFFNSEDLDDMKWGTGIATTLVAIATVVSFNTGTIVVYENIPVVATLVGANDQNHTTKTSGKHPRYETTNVGYVFYEVGGSVISFRRADGQAWPLKATLYRNSKPNKLNS